MDYKCIYEEKECIPDIIECDNLSEWNEYLDNLYEDVFVPNFIETKPTFKGDIVLIRPEPRDDKYEHGFIHMTHVSHNHKSKDINDRIPDLRRSERISMVRKIIENYGCIDSKQCDRIWYWEEYYGGGGRIRHNLLMPEERFLVVLEKARDVYFVVTSFYMEEDWQLNKRKRKYEAYKKQKTPLE